MRVLQLGPYPPPHGGVQSNLVAIRRFLLENGIANPVINLTRFRRADDDDVYYPKSAAGVLRLILQLRCNILHLHFGGDLSNRVAALGLVCALAPGARSVLTFHSGGYATSERGRRTSARTFRAFALRRFDRIIAVNREIVDFLRRVGVREERIRLIAPNAFTAADVAPGRELPEPLEEFFRLHSPVLVTVGLLEPEYDLTRQIEVLGALRDSHPRAGLVIIGAGSLEVQLRAEIQAKPYEPHIRLCGDVPHGTTLQAIARSNLMLRTTLYDGDAVSVREALHLGTPVLASDNGMRPPGVRLLTSASPAALLAAIEEALAVPPSRPAEVSSDERNVKAVLDLYRELLGS